MVIMMMMMMIIIMINRIKCQDSSNLSIVMICQNTEKSPEELRRLAVTQTPVRD